MNNKQTLIVLHSINATGWLVLGAVMVLLSPDTSPMRSTGDFLGAWIILFALLVKLIIFVEYVQGLLRKK